MYQVGFGGEGIIGERNDTLSFRGLLRQDDRSVRNRFPCFVELFVVECSGGPVYIDDVHDVVVVEEQVALERSTHHVTADSGCQQATDVLVEGVGREMVLIHRTPMFGFGSDTTDRRRYGDQAHG